MSSIVVGPDGRIRLPKWLREKLNISEGDKISFIEKDNQIIIKKSPSSKVDLEELNKLLKPMRDEIKQEGYDEEQMMEDLESAREELWNEWKATYSR